MVEKITILGATGSIGHSALDVIARHPNRFKVVGLSAETRMTQLADIVRSTGAKIISIGANREPEFSMAMKGAKTEIHILEGKEGLNYLAEMPESDVVITGIVGAAGLVPTLKAVQAGKKVLIANKEPLVMMGPEIMREAAIFGASIIPLDSEHNAAFQCLPKALKSRLLTRRTISESDRPDNYGVKKLILTASGGPFLNYSKEALEFVTPEEAADHPKWQMGKKISIDSATMMNKGLELIEACALFEIDPTRVEIVVHPQSMVHSLVEYEDGSILAQMAHPDMRIPIVNALGYPDRISSGSKRLSIGQLGRLDFGSPDDERFPCLSLAREAAMTGGTAPTILNAANEVAVDAFCKRLITFVDIPTIISRTLDSIPIENQRTLEMVLSTDEKARNIAKQMISNRVTNRG